MRPLPPPTLTPHPEICFRERESSTSSLFLFVLSMRAGFSIEYVCPPVHTCMPNTTVWSPSPAGPLSYGTYFLAKSLAADNRAETRSRLVHWKVDELDYGLRQLVVTSCSGSPLFIAELCQSLCATQGVQKITTSNEKVWPLLL